MDTAVFYARRQARYDYLPGLEDAGVSAGCGQALTHKVADTPDLCPAARRSLLGCYTDAFSQV